jgi:hypothetical protein
MPYKDIVVTPVDPSHKYVQKVLIEDYTGIYCGNCPRAADKAKELHDLYKDRIVIMGVHVGFFATPKPGRNHYDFRTETGTALDKLFDLENSGLPKGMINRMGFTTKQHAIPDADWGSKTSVIVEQSPAVGISLKPEFDITNKTLKLEAVTEFLKNVEPDSYLAIYLVEDSIVQYQYDKEKSPSDIPDYVHMHVLRDAVNSTWGDQLSTTAITAGQVFKKNYTYTIPEGKDWKPEHMKIIAYVHRYNSTYEVLNVEEVEVMK